MGRFEGGSEDQKEGRVPVKTSNVARPPLFPNCMSVFSLSPTMIVRWGSKLCLQSKDKKMKQ
jgi:hypothetical protein